ncbi:LuxR C-terminal-related transcriptional regulator [Streptomyces sp. 1331.2]|uniref:LuxR C-terminal-related transcriptional regulator n=1 Tax=Streptomyces sp. 1331.2 TaxID=1938835 RepID=UPI000BCDA938|nr:response regulator transcription factor [Streptomyces sp. 1331.2]SOB82389.1 DNA-binding response regulator, NarL/FixJ family, contains REC and HTH domains [Streptomyces sp. 1331.2]
MGRIRVLVVDGHRIFAEALAAALAAEPDVEVGAAGSAAAAERALERAAVEGRAYDVALIDADLGAEAMAGAAGVGGAGGSAATAVRRRPGPDAAEEVRRRAAPPVPPARRAAVPLGAPPTLSAGVAGARPAGDQLRADQVRVDQLRPDQVRPDQLRPTPSPDGITLLARLRRAHPGLRAVVLATADDPHRAARALHAGATGWVAKESSLARLLAVVRGVLRDETHLPPALLTGVIRELTTARRDRTESERLVDTLTPREKQILRCMVAGLGRQAVAERLYLSPHTVRTHMQNVLGKLGVHSTLAAVAVARRAGVSPAEPAVPVAPPSVATGADRS